MFAMLQILIAILIGSMGFFGISSNPPLGVCALFLGGFLVLAGLDRLLHKSYKQRVKKGQPIQGEGLPGREEQKAFWTASREEGH